MAIQTPRLASRRRWGAGPWFPALLLIGALLGLPFASTRAAPGGVQEAAVSFRSGDVVLDGTVLIPEGPGPWPAMAMVHGAGPSLREKQRPEAEAFAQAGIATLIYDKRSAGYSQVERSYELLADDALAAVRLLQSRPEVDPGAVGLWGLSEGAWVAPLAAARSGDVAFLVLVGASAISPARQVAWNLETILRHQGVAGSMLTAIPHRGVRLLADAGLLAEADHDPIPTLERLSQPVLALWGALDRIGPPADNGRLLQAALDRGGNRAYVLRFFPNADHDLRVSPDGFTPRTVRDPLAAGYVDVVAAWVPEAARGEAPGPSVDPLPSQGRPAPAVFPGAWHESASVQLAVLVLLAAAFLAYPVVAAGRLLARRRSSRRPSGAVRWAAGALTTAGLATLSGWVTYLGFVMITGAGQLAPVVAGRPLGWLLLQALALVTVAATAALALCWWSSARRGAIGRRDRWRLGALVAAGLFFIPWAASWGLLAP